MSWECEAGSEAELFFVGTVFMNSSVTFSFLTPLRECKYFYRVEHFWEIHPWSWLDFDLVPAEADDNVLAGLWEMAMCSADIDLKRL